jgi:hypothetical protein
MSTPMRRNRMHSWMDSTTRFSFSFSKLTMKISKGWSIQLSLWRTSLKRWRRMASGKSHFKDSLQEATPSLAYHSLALSSEHHRWFTHQCRVTSSISDAATQFSNATTKFSNAALSAASTSAQHAAAASPDVPAATSTDSSAHAECLDPRKPWYQ